jgi:hypothetical protein
MLGLHAFHPSNWMLVKWSCSLNIFSTVPTHTLYNIFVGKACHALIVSEKVGENQKHSHKNNGATKARSKLCVCVCDIYIYIYIYCVTDTNKQINH